MSNTLTEVPAVMVPGQVLEGDITPPSMGVNDFAVRMVPGAEAYAVGTAPQEITEVVSGNKIPRRYASVDYTIQKHGNRYGLTANQNSGYQSTIAISPTAYSTAVFVVKHSNTTSGAATILNMGGFTLTKNGTNWQIQAGSNSATFPAVEGVDVIVATSSGSVTQVVSGSGRTSFGSGPTASGQITYGTAGFVAAAQGVVVFDAALYTRRLSSGEVTTVRKNLETAWA